MRRYSLAARRLVLALTCTALGSLAVAASAQAVVVQNGQGAKYGVALVPGTRADLLSTDFSAVKASAGAPCDDPGLAADLGGPNLPAYALCLQSSNPSTVLQNYETFALTWDANHPQEYPSMTKGLIEQFLRDVADSSNSLGSPFAVTTQYTDANGDRALNNSKFGGGCIDYGATGGSSCQWPGAGTSGVVQGEDYPTGDPVQNCTPAAGSGAYCITDAAIQNEVQHMLAVTSLTPAHGYTPLIDVLLPPNVEVCLNSTGKVCSPNKTDASAHFCSYHSYIGGIPYVVQPWTVDTGCDEPNLPTLPAGATAPVIDTDAAVRLESPLSASQIAAIVNPFLNGWFANDGSEIDDNQGCAPAGPTYDTVSLGSGSYVIQREFNNGSVLSTDPFTYWGCAPNVVLSPSFVVPSTVDAGDTLEFDGSATASTLVVPYGGYRWTFGDGTAATGPSVVHVYKYGGTYNVTLTVTDRGDDVDTLTQQVTVSGPSGSPVTGSGSGPGGLSVRVQLLPQSLKAVLRHGISVRVTSNAPANGIATVSITRASAKKAGIKAGRGRSVRIGLGTVSSIKDGTVSLHLYLSKAMAKKLSHLKHVAMTIHLALVASGNQRFAIDTAGRY